MKPSGIIKAIRDRVGNSPCYLSYGLSSIQALLVLTMRFIYRFDIDTIDPSMAPASKSFAVRAIEEKK